MKPADPHAVYEDALRELASEGHSSLNGITLADLMPLAGLLWDTQRQSERMEFVEAITNQHEKAIRQSLADRNCDKLSLALLHMFIDWQKKLLAQDFEGYVEEYEKAENERKGLAERFTGDE